MTQQLSNRQSAIAAWNVKSSLSLLFVLLCSQAAYAGDWQVAIDQRIVFSAHNPGVAQGDNPETQAMKQWDRNAAALLKITGPGELVGQLASLTTLVKPDADYGYEVDASRIECSTLCLSNDGLYKLSWTIDGRPFSAQSLAIASLHPANGGAEKIMVSTTMGDPRNGSLGINVSLPVMLRRKLGPPERVNVTLTTKHGLECRYNLNVGDQPVNILIKDRTDRGGSPSYVSCGMPFFNDSIDRALAFEVEAYGLVVIRGATETTYTGSMDLPGLLASVTWSWGPGGLK